SAVPLEQCLDTFVELIVPPSCAVGLWRGDIRAARSFQHALPVRKAASVVRRLRRKNPLAATPRPNEGATPILRQVNSHARRVAADLATVVLDVSAEHPTAAFTVLPMLIVPPDVIGFLVAVPSVVVEPPEAPASPVAPRDTSPGVPSSATDGELVRDLQ